MSTPREWIFSSCHKFPPKNMAWLSFIQGFLGSLRCISHFFHIATADLWSLFLVILYFIAVWIDFFLLLLLWYSSWARMLGQQSRSSWLTGEPLRRVMWCLPSVLKVHSPCIQQPHHWVLCLRWTHKCVSRYMGKDVHHRITANTKSRRAPHCRASSTLGHPRDESCEPLRGLHANENVSEIHD